MTQLQLAVFRPLTGFDLFGHELRCFERGTDLLCSNCGYENPRGHRFCGMCGTPFPHRSLTVPTAQSTLSFASSPLEISPPKAQARIISEALPASRPRRDSIDVPGTGTAQVVPSDVSLETSEPEQITSTQSASEDSVWRELPTEESRAGVGGSQPEHLEGPKAPEPSAMALKETPTPAVTELSPVPERLTEAAIGIDEIAANRSSEPTLEGTTPPLTEARTLAEDRKPPAPSRQPDLSPESPQREPETTDKPPVKEPDRPPEPPRGEPPKEKTPTGEPGPETESEIAIRPQPEPSTVEGPRLPATAPAPLPPVRTPRPMPQVAVMPKRIPATPAATSVPAKSAVIHRSPESLSITSPPASAGMPTFQEVADAAGAPPLSPFEQLAQTPASEDEELKQFVANFRYTPPEETADELTMRSEVPVVDKEAPAEFHHPSFDGDEPPPEAEPHPTGQEYYPPPGEAPRSRFLEIDEVAQQAKKHPQRTTGSLLGLEARSTVLPEETARTSGGRKLLWTSIAVLIAIFAVLGFLEGRAQSTNAFRGPVEWVTTEYGIWRDKFAEMFAPAKPPQATSQEAEKQTSPESKPNTSAADQGTAQHPDNSAQPTATTQPTTPPTQNDTDNSQETNPQPQGPPASNPEPVTSGVNSSPAPTSSAKSIEPPPAAHSSKPQPGQEELNKALNASDATAAAAWLWRSTSRGNPEAPVRLADMYIKGNGVPRSCEQALVLLRSAAMKENAPARNRLAALYANGTCVARDKVRAYQLMSSALQADPNSEWAKENRQELWNQMTPSERAMAQKNR